MEAQTELTAGGDCPECDDGELESFDNASDHLGNTLVQRGGLQCDACKRYWYEAANGTGYER